MQIWIQHIMNSEVAHGDFVDYLEKVKQNLTKKIIIEAREGNRDKLAALAIELSVYETIQQKFKAEFKEVKAQQNFTEE